MPVRECPDCDGDGMVELPDGSIDYCERCDGDGLIDDGDDD